MQAVPQNAAQILQGVPADQIERLKAQAQAFATAQLTGAASTVNEVLNSMTGATNPQLQLELLCARLMVPAEDTTGLIARLESLEQRIAAGGTGSSPPYSGALSLHPTGLCPRAEQHRTHRRFRRPASKQPIWHKPSARHSAGTGSHRPGL